MRGLLHGRAVTDFEGEWFTLTDARCEPKPVQAELPIWIGGGGEKRTLRIAARYADGWNVPFVDPATFAHKREVLHRHCDAVGRDPSRDPHGGQRRAGVDRGEPPPAVRRAGRRTCARACSAAPTTRSWTASAQYVEAGADQVNLALRAPFDVDALDRFAAALHLDAPAVSDALPVQASLARALAG